MEYRQNVPLICTTYKGFRYLLFVIFVCLSIKSKSQIPNGDFENWETCIWRTHPIGWTTNGCAQFTSKEVLSDSIAYNGFLAMKLKNSGVYKPLANTGFPIALHPYSLKGYVKFNLADTTDAVSIKILLFNNSVVVDSGKWMGVSSTNIYTQISIPITQNALTIDSAMVQVAGGTHLNQLGIGTYFWVDSLSLDFTNKLGNYIKNENQFDLFPNPAEHSVTIYYKGKKNTKAQIKLYDMMGKEIKTVWDGSCSFSKINIDIAYLSGSVFFLAITTDNGTEIKKLIKQQ